MGGVLRMIDAGNVAGGLSVSLAEGNCLAP